MVDLVNDQLRYFGCALCGRRGELVDAAMADYLAAFQRLMASGGAWDELLEVQAALDRLKPEPACCGRPMVELPGPAGAPQESGTGTAGILGT